MVQIMTRGHVGPDGTLRLEVSTDLRETDVNVNLLLEPLAPADSIEPESDDWPKGFFEETYGSMADDPLQRLPQGEADEREPIL